MISVIIPTGGRPQMLRTALQSVADQIAVSQIDHVFVSEGKGDSSSSAICNEFPQLPITYILRERLPLLPHFQAVMRECLQSQYTAILHDDDWWHPEHLSNALKALSENPEASLYGASHCVVWGESSLMACDSNAIPWFGAGFPSFRSLWSLSSEQMLIGALLGTPMHYSSMVMPTDQLRKCTYVYDLGNSFDNERMLTYALSLHGSVLFRPFPDLCVRWHESQDNVGLSPETKNGFMSFTTDWMIRISGLSWNEAATRFVERLLKCPEREKKNIFPMAMSPWGLPTLAQHTDLAALPPDIGSVFRAIQNPT